MTIAQIDSRARQATFDALSEGVDILIIGGGVTGAGIAYDAALRGLTVGIVEAQDWSSGTSSRSSKLVHGGLRYLYQMNFKLVHEALTERGLLLEHTAPHLVKKMPLLWPFKQRVVERTYSTVGVGLYDAMAQAAHRGSVPIQRHLTREGALKTVPDLRKDALIGAMVYYDARVDDSRLVINLVRSAVAYGAQAANRALVTTIDRDNGGRVSGATVRDLETGNEYDVPAKTIINATGVWTEDVQDLAKTDGGLKVLASKGIHIVVPKERIKGSTGMFVRTEKSVLFIIPWKRYWIIGTTDTEYTEDLRHPVANKTDIEYVLDHANEVLQNPLTIDDVIGAYAGLRPLLQPGTKGDGSQSTKVSREHTVTEAAPGLVVIAGGKLTTYRVMAEDAVDFALGKQAKKNPSLTASTPLVGATGYRAMWNQRERLARENNLTVDHVEDLLDRYGSDATILFDMMAQDESLREGLAGAPEYLRAEIAFGVTHEGALHLEDTMCHRTRLTYEHRDRGLSAAEECADIMAQILGWDDATRQREIDAYTARCEAEEEALGIADEAQAQAARDHHGDVTPM